MVSINDRVALTTEFRFLNIVIRAGEEGVVEDIHPSEPRVEVRFDALKSTTLRVETAQVMKVTPG